MKKYMILLLTILLFCPAIPVQADESAPAEYIPQSGIDFSNLSRPANRDSIDKRAWNNAKWLIHEGLQNHAESISLPTEGDYAISAETQEELTSCASTLYYEVLDENPDIFYAFMSANFKMSSYDSTGPYYLSSIAPCYLDGAYEMRDIFHTRIENILKQAINNGMTEVQKALALHDYLIDNTTYGYLVTRAEAFPDKYAGSSRADEQISICKISPSLEPVMNNENLSDSDATLRNRLLRAHTAYGAVLDGTGVCQSYALTYKLLCTKAGINCKTVCSNELHHMWNLVQIGENWYNVDVTYDDPLYSHDNVTDNDLVQSVFGGSHANLLISDNTMLKNHNLSGSDTYMYEEGTLPQCNDKTYEENQVFTGIRNPMHYYNGYYYYTVSYANAADEYYRITADHSKPAETISKEMYITYVNMAITEQFSLAGGNMQMRMYTEDNAPVTAIRLHDLKNIGFSITTEEPAATVYLCAAYYDTSGKLVDFRIQAISTKNGDAEVKLADNVYENASQACIFFFSKQGNTLKRLTEELKIV